MDDSKRLDWIAHKLAKNNYNMIKIIRKTLNPAPHITRTLHPKPSISTFREDCVHNPASMFKKDAIVQIGGWNEKLTFCIDDDLFLRLAQIGNLVYTPKTTAICRVHGKNMSTKKMYAQELEVKAFYNHHRNAKLGELFIEN